MLPVEIQYDPHYLEQISSAFSNKTLIRMDKIESLRLKALELDGGNPGSETRAFFSSLAYIDHEFAAALLERIAQAKADLNFVNYSYKSPAVTNLLVNVALIAAYGEKEVKPTKKD